MQKIFIIMWYIWKARNDKRFAKKNWTAWQIHHAVAAYITTINSDTGVPDEQPQQARSQSNREQTDGDTATMATTPLLQHHSSLSNSRQGITYTFAGNDAIDTITQQEHTNLQPMYTTMHATPSGMNYFTAGNGSSPSQAYRYMTSPTQRFNVSLPALLEGPRCSTMPDQVPSTPRKAGIGIFIINTQVQPTQNIYIKAAMSSSVSVLMAEAAAMSLAAVITDRLQLQHTNFLSDNQDLAQFFNSADYSYTPDMRIKHLTQTFVNHTQHRSTGTFKINRSLNQTAHTLARQAFQECQSMYTPPTAACTCSNLAHVHQCPLAVLLQNVTIDSVMVLTARCC